MKRLLPLVICLTITGAVLSNADVITVSGDVSGTWSADTVLVNGEIRVPTLATLVIEPGVDVIFQGHYKLIVNGWLNAIGTEVDSILFTAADTSTGWNGIRFFEAPDSSHISYCIVQYGKAPEVAVETRGGGILCNLSNPEISHCTIRNNWSGYRGGGIACVVSSSPVMNSNMISGNYAHNGGGGILCENGSSPTISDNTLFDNYANDGAAIYCYNNSSPNIRGNTIQGNDAGTSGGGILCSSGSHPYINENIISGNSANNGHGGGVFLLSSPNTFELNEISGNFAGYWGGGIFIQSTSSVMNKNIIVANEASIGGGLHSSNANPELVNCIIWGNTPEQVFNGFSDTVTMTYSDCQGGWSGTGNIDEDPLFADSSQGDYHLQGNSPCIDTGDPDPMYNDPDSTRADMGCYYYNQGAGVDPREENLPFEWALPSCFPNPFNPTTTFTFRLPVASSVKLDVFDINGRRVGVQRNAPEWYSLGTHQITFDASNLASGVYIYRLEAGSFITSAKMVLIK
jgi:parallel beta-helix repeat protein